MTQELGNPKHHDKFKDQRSQQSECPKGFVNFEYETRVPISANKIEDFWRRLNIRESFTKGQIFPYRVEFDASEQVGPFENGELNIHHGPFLSAHGAIDGLTPHHRGLQYYYGAYVFSFRLVRLVRLDFYRENDGVRLRLKTFVAPWFRPIWHIGNRFFWKFFKL
jgi:hypothetical protein